MAYFTQEMKKELAPKIKEILKEYNMKGSLRVRDNCSFEILIKSGEIDFGDMDGRGYVDVNTYFINHYSGLAAEFLIKLNAAMNIGNHNRSDMMIDYHDVGWYVGISIGEFENKYQLIK